MMKYAAITMAIVTAMPVKSAKDSGWARRTPPSHACSRARSASARKSDMLHLLDEPLFHAVTGHPDVERPQDQRDAECHDVPGPALQVARVRHVARKDEAAQKRV